MLKLNVATTRPGVKQDLRDARIRPALSYLWQTWNRFASWIREEMYGVQRRLSVRELAFTGLCIVLGGWLRLLAMASSSLWRDEFYMLITSHRPFIQGLLQQEDYAAPLYQLLLRVIDHGLNRPEWALRAPAFIAGCLCIVAAWWLARTLFGRVIAALTAIFVAVNPIQIAVSDEARPYTFFALFSTLSVIFFHRLLKTGGRLNLTLYCLCSLLLVYSHYYGLLCVGAEVAFGIVTLILDAKARRHRREFSLALLIIGVAALPALWLVSRFLNAGAPATVGITGGGFEHWLDLLDQILATRHMAVLFLIPFLASIWPTKTVFDRPAASDDLAGSGLGQWSGLKQWWARRYPAMLLAVWVGFGMGLLVLVAKFFRPGVLTLRYLVPMAVPFVALSLTYVAKLKPGLLVLIAGLLIYFNVTSHEKAEWSNDGMRQLAQYLNSAEDLPEQLMVTNWAYCPNYINPTEIGLEYYGFHKRHLTEIQLAFPADKRPLRNPDDLVFLNPEELHSKGRIWVVAFSGYGGKVEERLRKDGMAYDSLAFGSYHLYRIQSN